MVAIVSGNSLGLGLTSLATLGQRGVFGAATQGQSNEQAFVNVANGNLVLQDLDDRLVSQGLDIEALRTYNSQGLLNDDNGDNWTTGAFRTGNLRYTGTLNAAGSTIIRTSQDGAEAVYAWDGSAYRSAAGAGAADKIRYDGGTKIFYWTDGDTGVEERYKKIGSLDGKDVIAMQTRLDACGNPINYVYDGNYNLKTVSDASGETLTFTYSSGKLTSISTTPAGSTKTTRVLYAYDSAMRASVTVDLSPANAPSRQLRLQDHLRLRRNQTRSVYATAPR